MNLYSEAEFKVWLDDMQPALSRFFELLPDDLREKLDYSVESLDELEGWLLEIYSVKKMSNLVVDTPIGDAAGRYVGELCRKLLGGEWFVELDDEYYGYGRAGLKNLKKNRGGLPYIFPLFWVTASIDRQFGDFISTRVRQYLDE